MNQATEVTSFEDLHWSHPEKRRAKSRWLHVLKLGESLMASKALGANSIYTNVAQAEPNSFLLAARASFRMNTSGIGALTKHTAIVLADWSDDQIRESWEWLYSKCAEDLALAEKICAEDGTGAP